MKTLINYYKRMINKELNKTYSGHFVCTQVIWIKLLEKTLFALLLLAATLLVMLVVGSGSTSAETLTVDDDSGAEYTKIQDAVDNATAGDTIRVWEGTYEENEGDGEGFIHGFEAVTLIGVIGLVVILFVRKKEKLYVKNK